MLGVQIRFAREGVAYGEPGSEIISAVDAKPANPLDSYDELACCEQWEPVSDEDKIKLRCPNNGTWGYRNIITTGRNLTHNFSLQQWDNLTLAELLLNGSAPDADGNFTPNGIVGDINGWLYAEAYAHDNDQTPAIVIDTWVNLTIGSHQFAESLVPHTLIAEQLQSPLNTGNVSI